MAEGTARVRRCECEHECHEKAYAWHGEGAAAPPVPLTWNGKPLLVRSGLALCETCWKAGHAMPPPYCYC